MRRQRAERRSRRLRRELVIGLLVILGFGLFFAFMVAIGAGDVFFF